jgi:WD40 repeat protein
LAQHVRFSGIMCAVFGFMVVLFPMQLPATAETPSPSVLTRANLPLPDGAVARLGLPALRAGRDSSLLFSPDGKVLSAFGGSRCDAIAQFWDLRTRRPLYKQDATAVAFSSDGKRVAIANGAAVHVHGWPSLGGKPLHELARPGSALKHLAFSPEGGQLAAGCLTSGRVTLWDVGTGKMVREFPTVGCEWSVEFSPDGKRLATGSNGAGAGLYEVETGHLIRRHPEGRGQARFSPDGTLLAQAHDGLQFWDVETGQAKGSLKTALRMQKFAFSPDGKSLAVGGAREQIGVWDLAGRKAKWVRPPASEYWSDDDYGVAFSPDGKRVAACIGYFMTSVRLWDAETGTELLPESVRDPLYAGKVALSPDGKVLAVAMFPVIEGVPPVELFDAATGKKMSHLDGETGSIGDLKFSPDGRWVASVQGRGTVQVWDAVRCRLAGRFVLPTENHSLAFSPDSTRLAAVDGDKRLHVWDLTGQRLAPSPVPEGSRKMAFAPDGRTLVTFSREHFRFWDLATGTVRAAYHQGEPPIKTGPDILDWILSPDGRTLATTTASGRLVLRESATGQTRLELRTNGAWTDLCFLSGRVLAVTGPDHAIALLDVRTGKVLHKLEGHNGTPENLSASADGTRLVSRVWQQDVLVWDTSRWAGRRDAPADARTDDGLWVDLCGKDAAAAYQAMWGFVSRPNRSVTFLAGRLTPKEVKAPAPDRLMRLIADLDDDLFATREAASGELIGHGHAVEAAVQAALESDSLEVRRRAQAILGRLRPPVTLEQDRAMEVLEHIGTAEAAALLRRLAGGVEGAPLSEAAKSTLGRLQPTGG